MSIRRATFAGICILIIVLIMHPAATIENRNLDASYCTDLPSGIDTQVMVTSSMEGLAGVAITFDDMSVNEWYDIRDLMNLYGAKMTLFVTKFDLLTEDEIEKLKVLKNEGHEIACHGLQHLDAVEFMKNHSLQTYLDEEIFPAISLMSEQGLTPISFAYPFGSRNSTIDAGLIEHFQILRSTTYTSNETRVVDLNQAYYNWQATRVLQAVGMDNKYKNTVEEIVDGLERAKSNNEVLILYGHVPLNTSEEYITPIDKLETILSSAETLGLSFYRISDLAAYTSQTTTATTTTTTTPTGNGITTPTSSIIRIEDIVIAIIVSSIGIAAIWSIATIVFPGKHRDVSYLP